MKKIITLLLVAVMCISLVACGSDTPQTDNNGSQQEQSNNKTDKEINIKKVDVVGTWINMASTSHGMKMVIEEDGTGIVTLGDQVLDLVWERIDDDTLTITANSKELVFEMGVSNGMVELLWQGPFTRYIMVTENDYNNMIEIVEITADNWQDYMEIKPFIEPRTDDFNDITDLTVGCALVLKDEYANRISASDCAIEYSLGGRYICPIEYNSTTKEFTLGAAYTKEEAEGKGYYVDSSYTHTDTDKLGSYQEYGFEFGPQHGCYPDSFQVNEDIVTAETEFYDTIEISRIQGNIYFKK